MSDQLGFIESATNFIPTYRELKVAISLAQAHQPTMSLKAVLIALFATSTIASPAQLERRDGGGKYLPEEEYEKAPTRDPTLGWCTFHLHEDWSTDWVAKKSHKIETHLLDASDPPALINYLPQTEVASDIPYTFSYDGLPGKLILKKAPFGVSKDKHIMEFEYNGETFKTDDPSHCKAGKEHESKRRYERDYDCGFTC